MMGSHEIEKVKRFFSEKSSIAAAYVFGSVAAGRAGKKSDIDLAVMIIGDMAAMDRVRMETALSNLLHRDVDLVIFHHGSPLLQHQILAYGRLIYEADPKERVRQEVFARNAYFDSAFLYKKLQRKPVHG
ncbi:MAG: type VII toxin-antitoxin system MntA family adenylyltransferase antitoxin [Desulfobacterales bacterium]